MACGKYSAIRKECKADAGTVDVNTIVGLGQIYLLGLIMICPVLIGDFQFTDRFTVKAVFRFDIRVGLLYIVCCLAIGYGNESRGQ